MGFITVWLLSEGSSKCYNIRTIGTDASSLTPLVIAAFPKVSAKSSIKTNDKIKLTQDHREVEQHVHINLFILLLLLLAFTTHLRVLASSFLRLHDHTQ